MEYTYDHTFLWFPRCRAQSSAYSWELGDDCWRVIFTWLVNWLVGGQLISGPYRISNKLGPCAQKCHWYNNKMLSVLYYYVHYLIYHYLPRDRQSMLTLVINNMVFILHNSIFYLSSNPYISNLYNLDQNLSLAYQTIRDHVFSDLKSDNTFYLFRLLAWLIYIFVFRVTIPHLVWGCEGVIIHCKLIPKWIESTPYIILFTDQ